MPNTLVRKVSITLSVFSFLLTSSAAATSADEANGDHRHTVTTYKFDVEYQGRLYPAQMDFISEMKDGLVNMNPKVLPRSDIVNTEIAKIGGLSLVFIPSPPNNKYLGAPEQPSAGTMYTEDGPVSLFSQDFRPDFGAKIYLLQCQPSEKCQRIWLKVVDEKLIYQETINRTLHFGLGTGVKTTRLYSELTYQPAAPETDVDRITIKNLQVTEVLADANTHPSFERIATRAASASEHGNLPYQRNMLCPKEPDTRRACLEFRRDVRDLRKNYSNLDAEQLASIKAAARTLDDLPRWRNSVAEVAYFFVLQGQKAKAQNLIELLDKDVAQRSIHDVFNDLLIKAIRARLSEGAEQAQLLQEAEMTYKELAEVETRMGLEHLYRMSAHQLAFARFTRDEDDLALENLETCYQALTAIGDFGEFQCYAFLLGEQSPKLSPSQQETVKAQMREKGCRRGYIPACKLTH